MSKVVQMVSLDGLQVMSMDGLRCCGWLGGLVDGAVPVEGRVDELFPWRTGEAPAEGLHYRMFLSMACRRVVPVEGRGEPTLLL
jgi:hypothetical protein